MRAGSLRHNTTIYALTDAVDDAGGPTYTESVFVREWPAAIEPVTGGEAFVGQQVQAEATHQIRGRYIAGVTTKMRIGLGTRRWNVLSTLNVDERNRELLIVAVERV